MPKAEKTEKKPKAAKKEKGTREPSAYNLFMKTELPRIKKNDASLSHKDAFKLAAANWKTAAENPANQTK
ncbi:hypothetical protein HDU97_006594 [Phlyctochytrium planicorne]|nr:hypothetical protein HDU97_006594 [Phlyctochytrium planicorne]